MSSFRKRLALAAGVLAGLLANSPAHAAEPLPGLGRPATAKELAAWDIDVRPDFKGLPAGAGSVSQGQDIWEAKCASCHGVFGESNEVFSPVVGGTGAADVKTGRVARLLDPTFPGRTTLMKVATVSTLWDYINRAMPWTSPKSLAPNEVYAVTAYLLNMGGVLPDDFVLSDKTMAQAQARMPNRNGMNLAHSMWPGKSLAQARGPDTRAVACMKDCQAEPKVASLLPDFARNNHGNLAEQNRSVGAQHGVDTTGPAGAAPAAAVAPAAAPKVTAPKVAVNEAAINQAPINESAAVQALLGRHSCLACHGMDRKLVGPGFKEVAVRYSARPDAAAYLAGKIKAGGSGVWGQVPMPPQSLGDDDAKRMARWLAEGARK